MCFIILLRLTSHPDLSHITTVHLPAAVLISLVTIIRHHSATALNSRSFSMCELMNSAAWSQWWLIINIWITWFIVSLTHIVKRITYFHTYQNIPAHWVRKYLKMANCTGWQLCFRSGEFFLSAIWRWRRDVTAHVNKKLSKIPQVPLQRSVLVAELGQFSYMVSQS